jgi:hypothetical protein
LVHWVPKEALQNRVAIRLDREGNVILLSNEGEESKGSPLVATILRGGGPVSHQNRTLVGAYHPPRVKPPRILNEGKNRLSIKVGSVTLDQEGAWYRGTPISGQSLVDPKKKL